MPPKRRSSDFDHIRERMEEARRRVIGAPGRPGFSTPFIEPAVDVYETGDAVVIVAEIAGIGEADLELEVEGSECVLRGERKATAAGQNATTGKWKYRMGRSNVNFCCPQKLTQTALAPSIRMECCKSRYPRHRRRVAEG